jgi:hypothetical protein
MKGAVMKNCQQCKLDFPDAYRFCGSCGGPLSDSVRCPGCGELAEGKWAFCTNCGRELSSRSTSEQASPPKTPKPPDIHDAAEASPPQTMTTPSSSQPSEKAALQEWYAAPDLFAETSESTLTPIVRRERVPKTTVLVPKPAVAVPEPTAYPQSGNGKTPPTLTMLTAYGGAETTAPPESQLRHGLLVGLVLLIVFGIVGFGGWYWWTHRAPVTQSPSQADSSSAPAAADSSSSASLASSAPKTAALIATNGGVEEEWKRLKEKRIGAKPSETGVVITAFEEAEKKYPRDYRFPYERAKLSIKGITSHHEAFGALSLAGQKAIDNGTAQAMLDSLIADQDGDFYKLSRGHHEWQALEDALRNKDKASLRTLHH